MKIEMTDIKRAMLSSFGCFKAEEEIRGYLEEAREAGATWEEFVEDYLSKFKTCECRTDTCTWSPEAIVERLEEKGILDMFQEYLLA